MKRLLTVTAIMEFGTGLVLVSLPWLLTGLLFGSSIDAPIVLTIARIAGVAILALAVTCWFARNDAQSPATKGLFIALVIYNTGTSILIIYAGLGFTSSGIGLWPVVLFHLAMAVWCITKIEWKIKPQS